MEHNRLKELRLQKNISGTEIAEYLNISPQYYYDLEKGARRLNVELAEKIADFYRVTLDYLLSRTDNPSLSKKDEREIEKILEQTREKLENSEGLMFNGEPASPEAIQSILDSMRIGLEIAKQRNKKKYTPKKYRKDKKEVERND